MGNRTRHVLRSFVGRVTAWSECAVQA
jgi:hypothetical protein